MCTFRHFHACLQTLQVLQRGRPGVIVHHKPLLCTNMRIYTNSSVFVRVWDAEVRVWEEIEGCTSGSNWKQVCVTQHQQATYPQRPPQRSLSFPAARPGISLFISKVPGIWKSLPTSAHLLSRAAHAHTRTHSHTLPHGASLPVLTQA